MDEYQVIFVFAFATDVWLNGVFAVQTWQASLSSINLSQIIKLNLHSAQYTITMPSSDYGRNLSHDINTVAAFLAHNQVPSLESCEPVDCVVICASAVLYQASYLFKTLESRPSLAKVVVLVGGIGHSTELIYDAVARHPEYRTIKEKITGLPEADVLHWILTHFFSLPGHEHGGPKIYRESRSTNCGANAVETRKVLDEAGITNMKSCIVMQDPTMSRRTTASFEKAYENLSLQDRPRFAACPVFVPKMKTVDGQLEYDVDSQVGLQADDLWEKQRLCELLVGEIIRLKDDENGYGPNGKGFIGHVDVPEEVEQAAKRIKERLGVNR